MHVSLRVRMTVLLLCITGLALTLVGVSNYTTAKSTIRESLEQNAKAKVTARAENLSSWVKTRLAELEVLSRTNLIRSGSRAEQLQYLRGELDRPGNEFVHAYGIAGTDGKLELTNGLLATLEMPGFEAKLAEVMRGRSVVWGIIHSQDAQNETILPLVVPIYDDQKRVIGVLSQSLNVSSVFTDRADVHFGEDDRLLLFARNGKVLYESGFADLRETDLVTADTSLKGMVPDILSADFGVRQVMLDGKPTVVLHAVVPDMEWYMLLAVGIDQFLQPVRALLWQTVAAVAGAMLVLGVLIFLLMNGMIGRVRQILRVTEQVAAGNLAVRPVPSVANDEIGALAVSVNGMVEHLRELFGRLEAIINQNDYAMIVLDASFNVTYFNRMAEKMLGYSHGEVVGRLSPLVWHDEREVVQRAIQYSRELDTVIDPDVTVFVCKPLRGIAGDDEWTYVRRDGSRLPVRMGVSTIRDPGGVVTGFVFVSSDISEQKRIQSELVQATRKADEANRAKSDFLARMSHEIRTPLNGIIGLAELMKRTEMSDLQRDYHSKLASSSLALLRIINDILDFSKVEAGKLELEMVRFRMDDVIHMLTDTIGILLGRRELEFVIETPDEMPSALIGDPLRLEQVLLNLCSNAVKFTERGTVMLRVKLLEVARGQAKIEFEVSDTGIGMSPEQLQRLFQPFTQADGSTSRKFGGTGLGLVISKNLIEMMDGELTVSSQVGAGSTFQFVLSFPVPVHTQMQSARLPAGTPTGVQVLIVEDHELLRRNLHRQLTEAGCIVHSARDWKDSLHALETGGSHYELVLLDLEGPDMQPDTWRHYRRLMDARRLPCLVMTTALGRDELLGMMPEDRPAGILVKPISRPALLQAVSTAMNLFACPAKRQENEAAASAELPESAGQLPGELRQEAGAVVAGKVLLAEDHEINRIVAVELLRSHGFEVTVAEDGRRAVELLKQNPPQTWDLVLMDLHMPEMDGYEAIGIIRRMPEFDRIPIIALTANAVKEELEAGLRLGMNDVITKPIQVPQMLATLRRWISPERSRQTEAGNGTGTGAVRRVQGAAANAAAAANEKEMYGWSNLAKSGVLDLEEALDRLDGKQAILHHMFLTFRRDYADYSDRIRQACAAQDREAVYRLLHTLKGAAGNLSAHALFEAAASAEGRVRNGPPPASFPEVERELERLQSALAELERRPGDKS